MNLQTAAKLWPTPTVRDFKSGKGKTQKERGRTAGPSLSEVSAGSLNVHFVEELMGYEIDHTALRHSGIASSRNRRIRSSRRSRKQKSILGGEREDE
jgi:hypothetical protein